MGGGANAMRCLDLYGTAAGRSKPRGFELALSVFQTRCAVLALCFPCVRVRIVLPTALSEEDYRGGERDMPVARIHPRTTANAPTHHGRRQPLQATQTTLGAVIAG